MSFKDKPLKKINADKRVTVDVIHNELINNIKQDKKKISDMVEDLERLKNADDNDEKKLLKMNLMKEEINKHDDNELLNYYLDNGEILSEYYSNKQNNSNNSNSQNVKTIYDLMLKKPEQEVEETNNIINDYICNIDDTKIKNYNISNLDVCKICNNKMNINSVNSIIICENCGYTETIIINSDKISYKDPPRETSYFAYKRINHFNEWLAQFQAKETTDIPENVYSNILSELKKDIFLDINNLKYNQIKDILKKNKDNKYYEHIPHIINVISGKKAPLLTKQYEEQFRMMFKEIQIPFLNNRPEGRKNFLSYSYVLHKFCQLLELDHLLINFPLLKSREKLQQQDKIWKGICKDLKWEYIASV